MDIYVLRQICGFLRVLQCPPPITLYYGHNIVESGIKHHNQTNRELSHSTIYAICNVHTITYIILGGHVFQQTVGTSCAPLVADLFLYSYEADFIQRLLKKNEKKLAQSFNFTFRYIDDVLSLNNSRFDDFVDRIYPIELEIKDTTDIAKSASYLDLHLEIDIGWRLRPKLYDKRDDFNFPKG